jgi:hypothetical protein
MQRVKKLCAVITLMLALSFSASAGEMPGGVVSLPPQSQATQQSPTATSTDMTESSASATSPIVESVVSLLQSLLPLF